MTGNTATTAQSGDQPNPRTTAIRQGRQADSARRRQRVIAVLGRAAHRRHRDQRLRHRPRRRRRPQLPLPAPRPAREDPRPRGHPAGHRRTPSARPSPAPPCRPTCSPPANEPNASTAGSGNWKSDCPKHSAKKPGRNQVSAFPPTSTLSTRPSVTSNSRPSTCAYNSTNATRTSPPRAPPTANSSPNSTPRNETGDTPNAVRAQHVSRTLNSSPSASEQRKHPEQRPVPRDDPRRKCRCAATGSPGTVPAAGGSRPAPPPSAPRKVLQGRVFRPSP